MNRPDDLPLSLRPTYEQDLQSGCLQAVYAPPLTNLPPNHNQPVAGYLLMLFEERILLGIERDDAPVERVAIPLDDLICVEVGEVLLFCWMKLVFGRASLRKIKIPFNLVGIRLFTTALSVMRRKLDAPPWGTSGINPVTLDLPLKFNNLIREWLHEDEKVLKYAFQPEVRARRFVIFERQVVPPLLAVLTNCQFLFLTEEKPAARERIGEYSEIYTYCPLSRIDSLSILSRRDEDGLADIHLTLVNGSVSLKINKTVSIGSLEPWRELSALISSLVQRQRVGEQVLVGHGVI